MYVLWSLSRTRPELSKTAVIFLASCSPCRYAGTNCLPPEPAKSAAWVTSFIRSEENTGYTYSWLGYIMGKFFIFSLFLQFLEDCPWEIIRGFSLVNSRLGNRPCRLDKYANLSALIKYWVLTKLQTHATELEYYCHRVSTWKWRWEVPYMFFSVGLGLSSQI